MNKIEQSRLGLQSDVLHAQASELEAWARYLQVQAEVAVLRAKMARFEAEHPQNYASISKAMSNSMLGAVDLSETLSKEEIG